MAIMSSRERVLPFTRPTAGTHAGSAAVTMRANVFVGPNKIEIRVIRHQLAVALHMRPASRGIGTLVCSAILLASPVAASALTVATGSPSAPVRSYVHARTSVVPRALSAALERSLVIIPSFSRQTGLACGACHYQFPQLTPFGRLFKLNGYTMTGLTMISGGDTARPSLKLSPIPPLSAMIVASVTHTSKTLAGAQNSTAMIPEQASLFLGGEITPRIGAFVQFTYAAQDGTFGVDNIDIRYANHTSWRDKDVLFGVTLHNNPTVQDVWNTVPAWGYPFMSSSSAPSPNATTLIEGTLGQQVLGLGGYALWNNLLYAEVTAYRSAQQGTHAPLDSASANVISGVLPYARVALEHNFTQTYLEVGGFGFTGARLFPVGVSGPTDRYRTLGVDAQLEHKVNDGGAMVIGRTSFIHEAQTLDASFAADAAQNTRADLKTFRANVSYLPNTFFGGTVGYFGTSGSADTLRFAPGEVSGSRTGSPNTRGIISELSVNPWQNTRFSLQYVAYSRFNGASTAYDVAGGRQASDNNTLYLYTWLVF